MSFIRTSTSPINAVPINIWAQTALSETEKLEFDNILAERGQWFESLKLDGTIIQSCTDLDGDNQTVTTEWAIDPRKIAKPWLSSWIPFAERWKTETNQTEVRKLIEKP